MCSGYKVFFFVGYVILPFCSLFFLPLYRVFFFFFFRAKSLNFDRVQFILNFSFMGHVFDVKRENSAWSAGFFSWRMVFRNRNLSVRYAHCCQGVGAPPVSGQRMCVCPDERFQVQDSVTIFIGVSGCRHLLCAFLHSLSLLPLSMTFHYLKI